MWGDGQKGAGKGGLARPAAVVLGIAVLLAVAVFLRLPPSRVLLLFEANPVPLSMPVAGIEPSRLVDTFGAPRSEGRRHEGIDIFAKRGQAVRSTTRGLVLSVGENRLGGRTVWVLGPGYKRHYYAHLERYGEVRRGQWIEAGHLIGTVGDSGNARRTPPHLHYGIYSMLGIAIDPYPLLSGVRTTRQQPTALFD